MVFNELQLTASAASANCFPAGVQAGSLHVLGRMTNVATDFKCHYNTFQRPPPFTRRRLAKKISQNLEMILYVSVTGLMLLLDPEMNKEQ